MAYLSEFRKGRYRVRFNNGQRVKEIYLPKLPKKQVDSVFEKVEKLIVSKLAGEDPPARIIAWLSEVGDELHERLVKADLTSSRTLAVPTIAAFVDQFINKRSSVKPAAVRAWAQDHRPVSLPLSA